MNSMKDMFDKLSQIMKSDSKDIDKLLNNIGISKEEAIKKINTIDKDKLLQSLDENKINNMINNLSKEDLDKISNIKSQNIGNLEQLYKQINNLKKE